MIEDIYEPVARYRDEFKEKFATLTREKFKALTAKSKIDIAANRKLADEIHKLENNAEGVQGKLSCCGCLAALGFIVAAVALVACIVIDKQKYADVVFLCIAAIFVGAVFGILMSIKSGDFSDELKQLQAVIDRKKQSAWEQMAPLNRLYTWDMTVKLIEATVPRLEFDPYFTAARLQSLRENFGWNDDFNAGKSIIFAQSGQINGNPFVFGQYLEMEWGSKTYEGTKDISWAEWEIGADGKRHRVTKYETLRAYVTKPIPVYNEHKLLLYGNDAAPNLTFSRKPSGFVGPDYELCANIKKMWRLNQLKAYSRNLDDKSNFTMMSNQEFETWFYAKDRNHEVEFRLLFTPVAQRQMLELMQDTTVGYSDDFTFIKRNKINILYSKHLNEGPLDTDPVRFRNWDYDDARKVFQRFNERYFKDIYFALAPLLAIPLYQQMRTRENIWQGVLDSKSASFWEHEAIANFHGDRKFAHPECVTRSILKTQVLARNNGECTVAVTAYGYKGVERVTYEKVYGGDNRWHQVAVHWTEYLPVRRTGNMRLMEQPTPSERLKQKVAAARESAYRRSIFSFLG